MDLTQMKIGVEKMKDKYIEFAKKHLKAMP